MAKQGDFLSEFSTRVVNELIVDTDDRSFLQTMGDAGYSALMGAVVGGVVQAADGMINHVRSNPKTLAQQAADAAIAKFKAQTGAAAKPTLAQQIDSMRQQLMDMQHRKKLDELAAVYEKNVGSVSKLSDENTYADWLHSIGADGTQLNSLAKYNEAKYNDSPEYQLLSGYSRAVEKGDISPLVGFAEYEHTNRLLQESIVGIKIALDVEIESFTTHFIDRVIGQTSAAHSNMRCGVEIADVMDALQNPIKSGPIRVMEDGDIRQTLYGKNASITISVRDKRLIQVNPRRRTTE